MRIDTYLVLTEVNRLLGIGDTVAVGKLVRYCINTIRTEEHTHSFFIQKPRLTKSFWMACPCGTVDTDTPIETQLKVRRSIRAVASLAPSPENTESEKHDKER